MTTSATTAEATTFNDLPAIRLRRDGASALIALHGAQILSWVSADGRERLFLSERARFDGAHAIRGGIPVIFPQFAERGVLPKHGFARVLPWAFEGLTDGRAVFALGDSAATAHWPHPFLARLLVALDAHRLAVTLQVVNTGEAAFAFTAALHTYLGVDDLAQAEVQGLQGCDYEDTAADGILRREHNHGIVFEGEIDRIYNEVVAPVTLVDGARTLFIEQDGFGDTVVWNPGPELAAGIPDLGEDGHRRFVCLEAAQALAPEVLAPGETWSGTQTFGH